MQGVGFCMGLKVLELLEVRRPWGGLGVSGDYRGAIGSRQRIFARMILKTLIYGLRVCRACQYEVPSC